MHPLKYTKQVLAEMRAKSDASYAWFHVNILGNELAIQEHYDLCNVFQGVDKRVGAWKRLCVCGSRGFTLKTTIGLRYLLWRGLTDPAWSSLLVEQAVENAIDHLDQKVIQLFKDRHFARPMMEAVYPERIPPGDFWTTKQFSLVRPFPDTPPTIKCAGLDSSHEGKHVDYVMVEDPEGADANKSSAPNEAAQKFILEEAEPLLSNPAVGQISVTLTPHGNDPTAYVLRHLEGEGREEGTLDNSKRSTWKIWWQPIVKEDGSVLWPGRGLEEWLAQQHKLAEKNPRIKQLLLSQYYLERPESGQSFFTPGQIDKNTYEILGGHMLSYRSSDYRINQQTGELSEVVKQKVCPLKSCYFYMHGDPKHRLEAAKTGRRSEWAFVVVAVTPDFHRFVLHTWTKDDANSTDGLEKFIELYRWFVPRQWTFDTTGAQIWFHDRLVEMEQYKYRHLTSTGRAPWDRQVRSIPRPSARMVESQSLQDKEDRIFDRLSPLLDFGWLHLHATDVVLRQQLLRIGTGNNDPVDAADALAQGPDVWAPPWSAEAKRAVALQAAIMERLKGKSLYQTPWVPRAAGGASELLR